MLTIEWSSMKWGLYESLYLKDKINQSNKQSKIIIDFLYTVETSINEKLIDQLPGLILHFLRLNKF